MNNRMRASAFALVVFLLAAVSTHSEPLYPLKASANGRYLVDQTNAPFLIMGDAPQALMVNISEAEAEMFFANRASFGFNTLWINLLCDTYTGGRADASTFDGVLPFTRLIPLTTSYDLTATNEVYFAHVDRILELAGQYGIQVLLDPIETGGFLGMMLDNGTNKCRNYGRFLGARYKDFDNILWMSGNDFQSWRTSGDDAVVRAVALGIKDMDTRHLQTTELDFHVSSSLDDTNWDSILGLNATYTYYPTYARLQQDYNRPSFLPNFMVEANYEFENLAGPVTTAPILRKQEYWTMTSGAAGQLYGNGYTWPFRGGWQDHLDTPGAIQFSYLKSFFEPRAWHDLVPDTNHVVVTAGYGAYSDIGNVADNDYLTAARTADGSLVVIYTPILRQFTVDMAKLSSPAAAHWFDPSSGTYQSVAGSPLANTGLRAFSPPGPNTDGDGGWVLVLETNPPFIPPPPPPPPPRPVFVQQNYATPQTPKTQVTVAYPNPQQAGNANILAIGWNDMTASILVVSDLAGHPYQAVIPTYRGNGMSQAVYYTTDIKGGTNAVTVTFDQAAVYVDLRVTEYSGLTSTNAFEAGASATGNSGSASSGSITVAGTNELLFAAGMTANVFTSPGAGFTERVITVPDADIIEDKVAAAPGSYSAAAALSAGAWIMQVAAFKATGPPTLRILLTATNTAVLSWAAPSSAFVLQEISDLGVTNWVAVTNVANTLGQRNRIVMPLGQSNRFYRLTQP